MIEVNQKNKKKKGKVSSSKTGFIVTFISQRITHHARNAEIHH